MKQLLFLPLFVSLVLASFTTHAQSNLIGDSEQPQSTSNLFASSNSFLPVEQVYQVAVAIEDDPVSYTHLTLPTICSV